MKFVFTFVIVSILGLACNYADAQNYNWVWAKAYDGGGANAQSISADAAGNIYTSGSTGGFTQGFIRKTDQSGNVIWEKTFFNGGSSGTCTMAMDSAANIYCISSYNNGVTVDSFHLTSTNGSQLFIAKLNTNGQLLWMKNVGQCVNNGSMSMLSSINIGNTGNIYISGAITDTVKFGSDTLTAVQTDGCIIKLNSNGDLIWVRKAECPSFDAAISQTLDRNDNLYITGEFSQSIKFDTTTVTGAYQFNAFIAKFDSSGKLKWLKNTIGGGGGFGIVTDDQNVYTSVSFGSNVTIDNASIQSSMQANIGLVKQDLTTGNVLWAKLITGSGSGPVYSLLPGMKINLQGSIIATGVLATGSLVLCTISNDGNVIWTKTHSGSYYCSGMAITQNNNADIFISGAFSKKIKLGNDSLISSSVEAAFVAKLSETLTVDPGPTGKSFCSLYPNPTTGTINIQFSQPFTGTIRVTNTTGQVVYRGGVYNAAAKASVNLSSCSSGIYFIELQDKDNFYSNRFTLLH